MANFSSVFAFVIIGLVLSFLSFFFIFSKIFEKQERVRILNCSITLGLIASSLLILLLKNIDISLDKTDVWQIDLLFTFAEIGKNVNSILVYLIILSCIIALFYEFFIRCQRKGNKINVKVPIDNESEEEKTIVKVKRGHYRSYDSDLIPDVDVWVGRDAELELLESIDRGVAVISGFGGQGKSALAAKCVRNLMRNKEDLFWDWRDCKEESDRFRTQLISVISNFTRGDCPVETFADANIADISKNFFKIIEDNKGIIVFDNVDHYVNINDNLFASDVSSFINEALRVDHRFLIIFTCRPRVNYPSAKFREVYLRGFSLSETKMLFDRKVPGGLKPDLELKVEKYHEFSEGHPLWLDIIASQISRKPASADEILKEMKAGQMDERAKAMLRSVWKSLNENQRNILRCMTEVQRSVEEEKIYDFVKQDVPTENQFNRAFRGLKAINLIIERTSVTSNDKKYDLHPMVRGFIRDEYHGNMERKRYISMVLKYYDNVLLVSRKDTKTLSVAVLEELATKIELEIENGDICSAIDTIDHTSDDFIERGLHEEYIRLSKKVFSLFDWDDKSWMDNDKFFQFCNFLIKTMAEVGKLDESKALLENYTKYTPSGTSNYISVCDLNCYVNWIFEDYNSAIVWGRRGESLKKTSGVDTKFDTSHNLALSLRDNGQIDEALKIFSLGLSIDEILTDDHKSSNRGAAFYGNIGRCIGLTGDYRKALKLYVKSYDLLESDSGASALINKGYASFWIAEALFHLEKPIEAHCFAKRALRIWDKRAPLLSRLPENLIEQIEKATPSTISKNSDAAIDIACKNFVATFSR